MPDNWDFVAAAYAIAAAILGAYWRMLVRKERGVITLRAGATTRTGAAARPGAEAKPEAGVRTDNTSRSHQPPQTGHPRPEPGKRTSLQ